MKANFKSVIVEYKAGERTVDKFDFVYTNKREELLMLFCKQHELVKTRRFIYLLMLLIDGE